MTDNGTTVGDGDIAGLKRESLLRGVACAIVGFALAIVTESWVEHGTVPHWMLALAAILVTVYGLANVSIVILHEIVDLLPKKESREGSE